MAERKGLKTPYPANDLGCRTAPKGSLKNKGNSDDCLTSPSDELRSLARDVRRICPSSFDPETFVIAKEKVANRLVAISRQLEVR